MPGGVTNKESGKDTRQIKDKLYYLLSSRGGMPHVKSKTTEIPQTEFGIGQIKVTTSLKPNNTCTVTSYRCGMLCQEY